MLGTATLSEINSAQGITPQTRKEIQGLWRTARSQATREAREMILTNFGILEEQPMTGKAGEAAAREASSAINSLMKQMRDNPDADPRDIADKLVKRGTENIDRVTADGLWGNIQTLAPSGFDLERPVESASELLAQGKIDERRFNVLNWNIQKLKELGEIDSEGNRVRRK